MVKLTIDGTEIDLSSGDLTLDVAGRIDLSADESVVYVSGRGDDYLHVFDSNSGTKIKSIFLGDHAMSAGIKSAKK